MSKCIWEVLFATIASNIQLSCGTGRILNCTINWGWYRNESHLFISSVLELTCCSLTPRSWLIFCRAFSRESHDSTKDWFSLFRAEVSERSLSAWDKTNTRNHMQYFYSSVLGCISETVVQCHSLFTRVLNSVIWSLLNTDFLFLFLQSSLQGVQLKLFLGPFLLHFVQLSLHLLDLLQGFPWKSILPLLHRPAHGLQPDCKDINMFRTKGEKKKIEPLTAKRFFFLPG